MEKCDTKMVSKYKEALGVWKHTIGKITHEITPHEDDNYLFLRAKDEAQKKDSKEILYRKVADLYFNMVLRSYPAMPEEEHKELKDWIGININQIIEDFLIAFKWTTAEKLKEAEESLLKNERAGNSQKIQ